MPKQLSPPRHMPSSMESFGDCYRAARAEDIECVVVAHDYKKMVLQAKNVGSLVQSNQNVRRAVRTNWCELSHQDTLTVWLVSERELLAGILEELPSFPASGRFCRARGHSDGSRYPFLKQAQRLDGLGQTDVALDLIYDQIDERFRLGKFAEVDQMLANLDVTVYSIDLLLGVLTASLPGRSRLLNRPAFFSKVQETLRQRGELEEGLLTGLE